MVEDTAKRHWNFRKINGAVLSLVKLTDLHEYYLEQDLPKSTTKKVSFPRIN